MSTPDPIFAVLDRVNTAEQEHFTACSDLDETDEAAMRRCNAACDQAAAARGDLTQIMPTTMGGLQALAAHYSRWGEAGAEESFLHLVRSLKGCDSEWPLRRLDKTEDQSFQAHSSVIRMTAFEPPCAGNVRVPTPFELSAAWSRLAPTARDQIGLIVLDMILQEFIHGDACVVGGQPEDRPFPDETDEHEQIRGAAWEASNRRLNELTPLIHDLFPDLFGQPGENPVWCANPGPGPARAAVPDGAAA